MRKRWRFRSPAGSTDAVTVAARRLGVHPLVASLLHLRGLLDEDAATRFLTPKLQQLHDPALIPGMTRAAERIARAVAERQPIVVYGDYDVDGITASAILWHMLSAAGADVSTYVPHRIEEGYGLNCEAIGKLCEREDGRKPLIVSVDCGITAVEPAAIARERGVDLIITDHHQFNPDALPDAYALVHPRLPGSTYPFGELCGAGVAFKLAWQVAKLHCGSERLPQTFRDLLLDLLSLAALGTVADIVPLIDENRVITRFGLGQIKRTRFIGLNAMIDAASLREEKVDAYHVGFVLGPRLNACGRMGHAERAVQLLTVAAEAEAMATAKFLTAENEKRRTTERDIFTQAKQMVEECGYDSPDCRAIVLGCEGWHQGVVGIVASRLVEAFSRPVVMLNIDNGEAHGSARSVEGVSIHEALEHCARHLTTFGGHAMAAGLRLPSDGIGAFRDAMVAFINDKLSADELTPVLNIDGLCDLGDITLPLVEQVERMAPFGRDNPAPVLCIRGAIVDRPPTRMGKQGNHLRIPLRHGGKQAWAVAFGMGDLADQLPAGVAIDVAFEPKINNWQGRRSVDLHVVDFRRADG